MSACKSKLISSSLLARANALELSRCSMLAGTPPDSCRVNSHQLPSGKLRYAVRVLSRMKVVACARLDSQRSQFLCS